MYCNFLYYFIICGLHVSICDCGSFRIVLKPLKYLCPCEFVLKLTYLLFHSINTRCPTISGSNFSNVRIKGFPSCLGKKNGLGFGQGVSFLLLITKSTTTKLKHRGTFFLVWSSYRLCELLSFSKAVRSVFSWWHNILNSNELFESLALHHTDRQCDLGQPVIFRAWQSGTCPSCNAT